MAGNPVFCHRIHLFGANLDFDRNAVHAVKAGVQRLISVSFRDSDIIFEAAGNRREQVVDYAKGAITGVGLIDNDAKAEHIHDFIE